MTITLSKPFAANTSVDGYDVMQVKKALNRLGLYIPLEKTGITKIPDDAVFKGLRDFQTKHGLPVTGEMRPGDATAQLLSTEAAKTPEGFYIWRTVEDGKVRQTHLQYNGTIRAWSNSPDPGEDFNCRCWAEPLVNDLQSRKKAILGEGEADFLVLPNPNAISDAPWHMMPSQNAVAAYDSIIARESQKAGIDPDLVRAIIYLETTQGWYDRYAPDIWYKSVLPMNIYAEFWKDLGYSKEQLSQPDTNVRVGIKLLKKIHNKVPNAPISVIATLYNNLGAKRVTDYGARVERLYHEKPWLIPVPATELYRSLERDNPLGASVF